MAETSIPRLSQASSIVLHNGKAALPIKAGQANVFKAKAGEHYRVLKGKDGEEQLLDNVVAKRSGDNLKLEYTDGTQVTLENYYVECKAGDCDVTVPGKTGEGYKISSASSGGAALSDGTSLAYAHGSPDALADMAQGNAGLQTALSKLGGAEITYIAPFAIDDIGGLSVLGLLGGGLGGAAAAAGGGAGAAAAAAVATVAAAASTIVAGTIVAGPVMTGNGLTVNLYKADGVTLLGTAGEFRSTNIRSFLGGVVAAD